MAMGGSQHSRLLQQIAIEAKRRDHVPGVMGQLGEIFPAAVLDGQCFHD
jgi:hypothetical protein